jgi:hypothetical protein
VNTHYPAVADRAGHRCEYCRAPEAVFNFPFEVEHIIPSSRQGSEGDSNLALACRGCNVQKSDRLTYLDELTGTQTRLFHPRQDAWQDHFEFDVETALIRGVTPIGRATVSCLQMNNPIQVEARRLWLRLGLFP